MSFVDVLSLSRCHHKIPQSFLRGIGLSDDYIKHFLSFSPNPLQFNSCFISYSTNDLLFAQKLYSDLQNQGVRCWFAKEDMKIGDKIRDVIYKEIGVKDKLLLIMSKESVNSDWVEEEVVKALAEEKIKGNHILLPIRIDQEVMTTSKAWAEKIRNNRHIGDFTNWDDMVKYKKAFGGLLRDLK